MALNTAPRYAPFSSVVERATRNGEVGCSIQPVGIFLFVIAFGDAAFPSEVAAVDFFLHSVSSAPNTSFFHGYLSKLCSNTARIFVDLAAELLTTLPGHEGGIWGIAYLPSSERVVTCSDDGTVMIWDVVSGEQGTSMEHEDVIVFGLAITKDGQRILSGDLDKRIKVWDVETHELIEEAWGSHKSGIQSIVLLPDDQFAASGDCNCDGTIIIRERLWNRSDPPDTRCRSCAAPALQIPLPVVIHVLKVGRKTRLLSSHSCQDRLLACLCCVLLQYLGEGGRRDQTFNRDWW
jgi:WD40 repeat protein